MRITHFFNRFPALYYSLIQLIGVAIALKNSPLPLIPLGPLLVTSPKRFFSTICVLAATLLYCQMYLNAPDLPKEGLLGKALFAPHSVAAKQTLFGHFWAYAGTLQSFVPNGQTHSIAKRLPCQIHLKGKRIPTSQNFYVVGTLKKTQYGHYFFTVREWHPIEGSWSFAEGRFLLKERCKKYLGKVISHRQSASFLTGMVTGVFDDPLMKSEFARFGLQHIMAISGFHFALLAALVGFFFRFLMPRTIQSILLLFFLTCYTLFLGPAPSILRAWIALSLTLLGALFQKTGQGLNSLGIAILALLVFDPCFVYSIGFQFSIAITGSLLLFTPLFEKGLQEFFPKRPYREVVALTLFDQHLYLLLSFFRGALALLCAVNVVAIPLTLLIFHKFPLLSLLYNLFFPFMVSFALFLLLIGSLCYALFPPLGEMIHFVTTFFTKFLLSFTSNLPPSIDFYWRVSTVPTWGVVVYLTCLFALGASLREETQ